ncbi:MAG: hypothetical protein KDC34_03185 [Saprospiraceae bacterium]|nr:hypothetical protein [Saprospiraceae bacterium]
MSINISEIIVGILLAVLVSAITSYCTISYQLHTNTDLEIKKQTFFDISNDAGQRLQNLREVWAHQYYPGDERELQGLLENGKISKVDWESKVHTYSALLVQYFSTEDYSFFHEKLNNAFYHLYNRLIKEYHHGDKALLNEIEVQLDSLRDNLIYFNMRLIDQF